MAQLQTLIAENRRSDVVKYFMKVAVGLPEEFMVGMEAWPTWESSVAVAHTISYDGEIMGDTMSGNPASLNRFAGITTPTLVMVGSESPPYQHNAVKSLADLLADAQLRTMGGQDHGVVAEVLAPALVDFFLG